MLGTKRMLGISLLLLIRNQARMHHTRKKSIKNQILFSASKLKTSNLSLSVWKHKIKKKFFFNP